MKRHSLFLVASITTALLSAVTTLQAADLSGSASPTAKEAGEAMEVPGGDIFGFTSGTDVGKVGDRGVALENSGAYGISNGRWRGVSQKLEFSGTFVENWSFATSLFGAWSSLKNNSDFGDRAAYHFDGASIEVRYRAIERSTTNPFALTLAVEPRLARIDAISGLYAPSLGAEFKAQIDAPVADRLYWAANANFATGRSRDPISLNWSSGSDTSLSTALTYELMADKLFLGAETRWQQTWRTGFFGSLDGQALFVGPTVAWKPNENVMLNVAFLPQVIGKARGMSGPLDLDNFERANYRVKLAIAF